ncbi:hypothetical protein ACLXNF_27380, partial [Mycobacteroides chelonae]|uniref:hypothetical protein n=1 Tax=Mycobacteroides chelonae TaxID=1774 RepID=UPI0039ED8199
TAEASRVRRIAEAERLRWRELERASNTGRATPTAEFSAHHAGQRWTVAEISIALDQSLSHQQAAHLTGRTEKAMRRMRQKLNPSF